MLKKIVAATAMALSLTAAVPAAAQSNAFRIEALSTQPDLVTGDDVLLRVDVPSQIALADVRVLLNGVDWTKAFFQVDPAAHALMGYLPSLLPGENLVEATAAGRGGPSGRLTLTNYAITGPIISGPHEVPFYCMTHQFTLPVTGGNLGTALDADCSITTRIDYVYHNGTAFRPLDLSLGMPADVVNTTTNAGVTVPFIVRVETGTVNRAIYQIAVLHDWFSEPTPNWHTPPRGWNRKLIYTHGGGCQQGWYIQGATAGTVLNTRLGRGFAQASSSLNVFGNNCNDLLASETTIMVKERFVERYGVPKWTIGTGSSGGAYQSNQTADAYPGTFDGIVTMNSFPDVTTGVVTLHDARLLDTLFNTRLPGVYSDAKQKAISGFRQFNEIVFLSRSFGTSALRLDPTARFNDIVPANMRYSPTNPEGARATIYDHTVNVYGSFGPYEFAQRPLDNVGVQYGLKALNDGVISVDEFLQVNELIGGVDIDFKPIPQRTVAFPGTMDRAYRSGRVLNGGGGLKNIPIITQHGFGDAVAAGDIHLRFYSWSIRERLIRENGHADNQVIISSPPAGTDDLFVQMNNWLDAIWADSSSQPLWKKVMANKPSDVVDACWISGVKKPGVWPTPFTPSECNTAFLSSSTPNLVAGAPIAGSILKCQLKAPDPADYTVAFTAEQWAKLNAIFPTGVCDWSKPGVEETFDLKTWASFGPSPKNLIFDITKQ